MAEPPEPADVIAQCAQPPVDEGAAEIGLTPRSLNARRSSLHFDERSSDAASASFMSGMPSSRDIRSRKTGHDVQSTLPSLATETSSVSPSPLSVKCFLSLYFGEGAASAGLDLM